MKKDFIVSKIEAPQNGSHYVLVAFTDPNALKLTGGGGSGEAVPFTSPEDLMKIYLKSFLICLVEEILLPLK
jgi:hypothetical protein